ncbi:MAG: hypothetical protein ACE5JE_02450 [Thermoplasmata archaeon]
MEGKVLSLIAVVLVLVIISFVVFPGTSTLRWGMLILVLISFGLAVFASLYRTGIRIPPIELPDGSDSDSKGDLPKLSEILRKAEKGMRYSQVAVALRVREAFLARLQTERNLESEELESILVSPRELGRMVGDSDIQAFLEDTSLHGDSLLTANTPDRSLAFGFAQEDFVRGLSRIVRAMEAWR